jgi:hypothetical protein
VSFPAAQQVIQRGCVEGAVSDVRENKAIRLWNNVTLRSDVVAFDYPAKSGVRRTLEVDETTGGACQLGRPEARSSRSNTRPSLSTNSRAAASTTQRVLTTTAASRTGIMARQRRQKERYPHRDKRVVASLVRQPR